MGGGVLEPRRSSRSRLAKFVGSARSKAVQVVQPVAADRVRFVKSFPSGTGIVLPDPFSAVRTRGAQGRTPLDPSVP